MFSIPCLYRKYQSNENEAYAMAFIELFIDTVFYLTGFCESKKSFFHKFVLAWTRGQFTQFAKISPRGDFYL